MKILITGGAGFIGSALTKKLIEKGHAVTVVDNLARGYRWAIDPRASFIQGDLQDWSLVTEIFQNRFDGVIHCAGFISVPESVAEPARYLKNNVLPLSHIVKAMLLKQLNNLIFSSSAAVYGNAAVTPIPENAPSNPESPYGRGKLLAESILKNEPRIKSVSLRYFNAAGAVPDGGIGEAHEPETHLIPNVIQKTLKGDEVVLFGNDYPTVDGTCVRDYVHVLDLVEAHILALEGFWHNEDLAPAYNIGAGVGYSNMEIVKMAGQIIGKDPKIRIQGRRPGDPAILIADVKLIKKDLGFQTRYSDPRAIIKTAYEWHKKFQQLKI